MAVSHFNKNANTKDRMGCLPLKRGIPHHIVCADLIRQPWLCTDGPAITLHQIKQDSLDLYEWFSTQATSYLRAKAEAHYGCRLAAVGAEVEGIRVPTEILADVTGDALADPQFLAPLAKKTPPSSDSSSRPLPSRRVH